MHSVTLTIIQMRRGKKAEGSENIMAAAGKNLKAINNCRWFEP